MSHTPGPWIVESDGVSVAMGDQVVIVAPAPDGAGRGVERANARLIAEAPAMLDLLKRAIARLNVERAEVGYMPILSAWGGEAAAMIARIEGKS